MIFKAWWVNPGDHENIGMSAASCAELFALIHVLPWRSLRIYRERGVWSAVCQTWAKTPNRAQA